MKTVYRYDLNDPSGVNHVQMHRGAIPVGVGITGEYPNGAHQYSLWAEVDTNNEMIERTFVVAQTGVNMDESLTYQHTYIGTINVPGVYAKHVFEVDDKHNI